MPVLITHVPIPRHYQDTKVHCGFACVTMLLDHLSAGRPFQPSGEVKLGNLSQVMMHMVAERDFPGNEWCTSEQMTWLLTRDSPARRLRISPQTGNAGEVLVALDQAMGASHPVAVRAKSGGHWIVVHGRTRENGSTTGFFVRDPWLPLKNWAYGSQDENENCRSGHPPGQPTQPAPCLLRDDDNIADRASKHFTHKRGGNCPCPAWTNLPVPKGAIDATWIGAAMKIIASFSPANPLAAPMACNCSM